MYVCSILVYQGLGLIYCNILYKVSNQKVYQSFVLPSIPYHPPRTLYIQTCLVCRLHKITMLTKNYIATCTFTDVLYKNVSNISSLNCLPITLSPLCHNFCKLLVSSICVVTSLRLIAELQHREFGQLRQGTATLCLYNIVHTTSSTLI